MMLKLYTQNDCHYCTKLIQKLASWGLIFDIINISKNDKAKSFLKERGHKTVPVLYVDDFWVNENIDTDAFTEMMFYDRLDVLLEKKSPSEINTIIEKY